MPESWVRSAACFAQLSIGLVAAIPAVAREDIEFVQEHLPEVAMDNRYATLPLWAGSSVVDERPNFELQTGYAASGAGDLTISGPLVSAGAEWRLSARWRIAALGFYDKSQLHATSEQRDLQTLFAPETPISRPAPATFTGLDGTARDMGLGFEMARRSEGGLLGAHEWVGGVLWQSMKLDDYRFDYVILSGPEAGVAGTIDFDAEYKHIVPFVGLALPREYGNWSANAHMLVAYPFPRRGVIGHITGPNFDIRGDTADTGEGKHFGDPSVTFGYSITYRPAHLTFDLGALATQAFLEPRVHRGIERNVLMSFAIAVR